MPTKLESSAKIFTFCIRLNYFLQGAFRCDVQNETETSQRQRKEIRDFRRMRNMWVCTFAFAVCVFPANHITDAAGENTIGEATEKENNSTRENLQAYFLRSTVPSLLSRSLVRSILEYVCNTESSNRNASARDCSTVASLRCCDSIISWRRYVGTAISLQLPV